MITLRENSRGLAGTPFPESPHNYRGIAGETSFGIGHRSILGIGGGERLLEFPHRHLSLKPTMARVALPCRRNH